MKFNKKLNKFTLNGSLPKQHLKQNIAMTDSICYNQMSHQKQRNKQNTDEERELAAAAYLSYGRVQVVALQPSLFGTNGTRPVRIWVGSG